MTTARFSDLPRAYGERHRVPTPRQRHILRLIRDCILGEGRAPTVAELMAATGIRSPNGVAIHLEALRKKGYIEVDYKTPHGIRLVGCRLALEYDAGAAGHRLREALEDDNQTDPEERANEQ